LLTGVAHADLRRLEFDLSHVGYLIYNRHRHSTEFSPLIQRSSIGYRDDPCADTVWHETRAHQPCKSLAKWNRGTLDRKLPQGSARSVVSTDRYFTVGYESSSDHAAQTERSARRNFDIDTGRVRKETAVFPTKTDGFCGCSRNRIVDNGSQSPLSVGGMRFSQRISKNIDRVDVHSERLPDVPRAGNRQSIRGTGSARHRNREAGRHLAFKNGLGNSRCGVCLCSCECGGGLHAKPVASQC
jgi:hypothetical protein